MKVLPGLSRRPSDTKSDSSKPTNYIALAAKAESSDSHLCHRLDLNQDVRRFEQIFAPFKITDWCSRLSTAYSRPYGPKLKESTQDGLGHWMSR